MRNAKALLALLLVAIAALAAVLIYFSNGSSLHNAAKQDASQPGVQGQVETSKIGQPAAPSEDVKEEAPRPNFDVVRVEKDGSVVMAGQAEAGATVIVRSGKTEIGRTTANENGEWILQKDRKLEPSEHGIELSAQSPDGERTLYSKQRLALSLSDPKQGEPLVALTEEGKPTRILQMPTPEMLSQLAKAEAEGDIISQAATEPPSRLSPDTPSTEALSKTVSESKPERFVGFASIDYEDADQKSMVYMSGIGTPGSRVAIYVDNILAGIAVAEASGNWNYADNKQLDSGTHLLRADLLDTDSNEVVARAEVNFEREPVSTAKTEIYDLGSKTASNISTVEKQTDAVEAAPERPEVIIVKQGDTLWHIAEKFYGDGTRYTQIFKNNRNQIRNPHRIYPDQRFVLPNDKPVLTR